MSERFNRDSINIDTELAMEVNLKPAIVLEVINKGLFCGKRKIHGGKIWTRLTIEEMQNQMPFFSQESIKRYIQLLIGLGYIERERIALEENDRSYWYCNL